ncbi:MAG: L-erythro-3,5-diaminohexanoate dehydrogenase [Candidatus Eremiobacteraeota bacterium]|nr:L-erythro-3,5-diaminohexanoate dehydrogenase [Candidatus Eremiobacteraeota bacterium]
MSIVSERNVDALGSHRVLEPAGALPQNAWKIDNTPVAFENEILCDVETLNIDSASFRQISEASGGDVQRVMEHILHNVKERGKQHNAVTGSGGMFVGRVLKVGERLRGKIDLAAGDRIASLVSLTLTPLRLEAITEIDMTTGRVWVRAKAILFESGIWAKLPADIGTDVALATLDVAGAPAQVRRMTKPGDSVVIIGADGKSGMLSCLQAKAVSGPLGRVVGIVPDASTESSKLLLADKIVDELLELDARDAVALSAAITKVLPGLADLTVNCVNVAGTELSSILCTKENGIVYFFSMCTSFTAAALGAEGVGKDVTMIVGNGYAKGHADTALQTLRDYPHVHAYFQARYASL